MLIVWACRIKEGEHGASLWHSGGQPVRSVELFAGAGGLAMGVSQAEFTPEAVVEWDRDTCITIRSNQERGVVPVAHWPLLEGDVRGIDFHAFPPGMDLVSGGPPCQPFSLGGKHRGQHDERDMFPQAVRAVRELQPRAFVFENVKGLLRQSFAKYFEYVLLQLTHPDVMRAPDDGDWTDHLARLERHHTGGATDGLSYKVVFRLLNAADYGVPQKRERVFIVGFRADLGLEWSFPEATHSQNALLWDQWVTGDYWERHRISRPQAPEKLRPYVRQLQTELFPPVQQAWRTVRDAIGDLPDPEQKDWSDRYPNHRHNPGARAYAGHTGSLIDEPAKTLKAGDHGVPGGENMLAFADGHVRYLTVRESARLQDFPDDYVFPVSWTESMRQLGNAVPVSLARTIAASVGSRLNGPGRAA